MNDHHSWFVINVNFPNRNKTHAHKREVDNTLLTKYLIIQNTEYRLISIENVVHLLTEDNTICGGK